MTKVLIPLANGVEEKSSGGISVVMLFGIAAIIFGIGYALRPVSDIVDELHDSQKK